MGVAMKLDKKRLRKGASMVQEKLAERQTGGNQSDGTQAPATATPDQAGSAGPSKDAIEKLKALGQLHDQGVLTDEEFSTQKAQILSG